MLASTAKGLAKKILQERLSTHTKKRKSLFQSHCKVDYNGMQKGVINRLQRSLIISLQGVNNKAAKKLGKGFYALRNVACQRFCIL